jgi:GntR family transcriptional regulator / MocR family aminotransferase
MDTGLLAGLRVQGLHAAGYWHSPACHRAGLILGFSTPPQHSWHPTLDALMRLLEAPRSPLGDPLVTRKS